jgi:DNA ligase-1
LKLWPGVDLQGVWIFTRKIDGIHAFSDGTNVTSRKGKPLYNIPFASKFKEAEIFCGSFKESQSITRSSVNAPRLVKEREIFHLDPIDSRLFMFTSLNPTVLYITTMMNQEISNGNEGLVLYGPDGEVFKVKPVETYDVLIIGITEGKGKNKGRLGAFITPMGKVAGMTDKEREEYFTPKIIGETIEVDCMQLTPKGKFRHPRFIRMRYDK